VDRLQEVCSCRAACEGSSQTAGSCPLRAPEGPETAQRKGLETADLQNAWHLFTQASFLLHADLLNKWLGDVFISFLLSTFSDAMLRGGGKKSNLQTNRVCLKT